MLKQFWYDNRGSTGAEYAVLISIVAMGLVIAIQTLNTSVQNTLTDAATCIDSGPGC